MFSKQLEQEDNQVTLNYNKKSNYVSGVKFGDLPCTCGHTLENHDFKVKEGVVIFGTCKKCKCSKFIKDN